MPKRKKELYGKSPMVEAFKKLEDTLEERGKRYGNFKDHAFIAMELKRVMRRTDNWEQLSDDKQHALDVIADKTARILNGDPEYKDNWHDIGGYAKLAEDGCDVT